MHAAWNCWYGIETKKKKAKFPIIFCISGLMLGWLSLVFNGLLFALFFLTLVMTIATSCMGIKQRIEKYTKRVDVDCAEEKICKQHVSNIWKKNHISSSVLVTFIGIICTVFFILAKISWLCVSGTRKVNAINEIYLKLH